MNIVIIYMNFGKQVKSDASIVENPEDGTHTIVVKEGLSPGKTKKAILHEVGHIMKNDFNRGEHANLLEKMMHAQESDVDLVDINFYFGGHVSSTDLP